MKCLICENEFVAKRADAKFCSSTCRSKGSRLDKVQMEETPMVYVEPAIVTPPAAPEKEKKLLEEAKAEVYADMPGEKFDAWRASVAEEKRAHCSECITFESGVHWCPNTECGCWETKEEQEASLEAFQRQCSHPKEESFMSRCLSCGRLQLSKAMSGKHMSKELCTKHNGAYKHQCGCKAKEE